MIRIGLDTNVVLRFLLGDDPEQSPAVRSVVARAAASDATLVVDVVVMAEVAWVLARQRKLPRAEVVALIELLLRADPIEITARKSVEEALLAYQRDGLDFPDALIGALNRTNGCVTTLTFDRRAARLPSFTAIET